jgi:hypothetical protein
MVDAGCLKAGGLTSGAGRSARGNQRGEPFDQLPACQPATFEPRYEFNDDAIHRHPPH